MWTLRDEHSYFVFGDFLDSILASLPSCNEALTLEGHIDRICILVHPTCRRSKMSEQETHYRYSWRIDNVRTVVEYGVLFWESS